MWFVYGLHMARQSGFAVHFLPRSIENLIFFRLCSPPKANCTKKNCAKKTVQKKLRVAESWCGKPSLNHHFSPAKKTVQKKTVQKKLRVAESWCLKTYKLKSLKARFAAAWRPAEAG